MSMQPLEITACYRPVPACRGGCHAVTEEIKKLGHHVVQIEDGDFALSSQDVVFFLENANFFPRVLRQLQTLPPSDRPFIVVWHWEPLPLSNGIRTFWPRLHVREIAKILLRDARATDIYTNYALLRRLAHRDIPDLLITSSAGWQLFLNTRGFESHCVPIGYAETDGNDMKLHRDIDALFLGCLDIPRRKRIIKALNRQGINLVSKGSWYDASCWGASRTKLINRSKVFLNIQRQPGETAAHRLILGMANKSLVISEPIHNPAPFIPGEHFIDARVAQMPDVVRYYIENELERRQIVEKAYRFVTEKLTMEKSVADILALIHSRLKQMRR